MSQTHPCVECHEPDLGQFYIYIYIRAWDQPRGQSFWLLIMRSWARFPVLPWGFFLEGEDPHGDHGLGSLVELRFKAPSCHFIPIYHHPPHRDNVTVPHGHPNIRSRLHFSHNGRGDHKVHKGHLVALKKNNNLSLAPESSSLRRTREPDSYMYGQLKYSICRFST
jgi:hypothetical protein